MKRSVLLALALAFAVSALVACSDSSESTSGDAETDDSPVVDPAESTLDEAGEVMVEVIRPERIVSLSPTATEMLFALGAGEQVVAVDQYSTYPENAPTTELDAFNPNVEAVLAYDPDLVVIVNDANDLVAGLEAVGVPVFISAAPADVESGYEAMTELGIAVDRPDETAAAIASMRTEMEQALAAVPDTSGLRIYHELDDTYYSASSNGFIGALYASLGLENIADEADAEGSGFPQLTEEYIVEADPELIVITDQVSYTAEDVAAREGWDEISAVKNDRIVVVNADIASRWGPRLPQFVDAMAEELNQLSVDA